MNEITVQVIINAPVEEVWKKWTTPQDIVKWNNASEEWHTTKAEVDLSPGGKFLSRMEAKDGSFGFDFEGVYDEIVQHKYIEYHLADNRKVKINFNSNGKQTMVSESFDPESIHSYDMQRKGWQAILENFRKYAEASNEV